MKQCGNCIRSKHKYSKTANCIFFGMPIIATHEGCEHYKPRIVEAEDDQIVINGVQETVREEPGAR